MAALSAAVFLLPGCGDTFQPPAAVVNGVRITQDTLAHQLDVVLTNPQLAAQVSGPEGAEQKRDITRRVLASLIRKQVIVAYARAHGITVAAEEVDEQIDEIVAEIGGMTQFQRELRRRRLALEDLRENIREGILAEKVRDAVAADRIGAEATPEQKEQAFTNWLIERLGASAIEVNPRFGHFDPKQGVICPITSTADTFSCPAA